MKISLSSFGEYSIGSVELSENDVRGDGGHIYPVLRVPLRLTMWHNHMKPREGIGVDCIGGTLALLPHQQLGYANRITINHRLHPDYCRLADWPVALEFPLNALIIARIEAERNGGDARFRIEVELFADSLGLLNQPQMPSDAIWGFKQRWPMRGQAEFAVPRDKWIENVLPHVGFGVTHVMEFPAIPVEACSSLSSAFRALRDSQELHKQGHYDEAVGKCRIALESILERGKVLGPDGKEKEVPVLPPSWEKKLGTRTFEWLKEMFPPLKDAANKVMHPPYRERCGQLESQLILAVSTSLMVFAARIAESSSGIAASTKAER